MIEAVENHMPQVIVIDEIGTELEALAARTIAERGVQLVATAHGNSLGNLLVNPTLSDLVGGIQTVTLGDEEARRRHTQKSILERKAPPTFDVVVEQQSWQELIVHRDVADTVDSMLRGQLVVAEERTRDEETGRVSARRITTGGMEVPTWGIDSFGNSLRDGPNRVENDWNTMRRMGQQGSRGTQGPQSGRNRNGNGGGHGQVHAQPYQVRALAPTGTAPGEARMQSGGLVMLDTQVPSEGIYRPARDFDEVSEADGEAEDLPIHKVLRIYPFGISRDRLEAAARQLHVPIIITKNQQEASAVITAKNYYRRQSERLQQAEDERKTIIILKNNTIAQMQHALARIFDIPMDNPLDEEGSEDEPGSSNGRVDDPTTKALLETEDAIHQVLNKGLTTAELAPANAYIRRLQHQMATRYNLASRSRGKEPNRRVKIFRTRES
jgi:PHD/YefM family antitoxin component YafN of YafNO toxin-antitoxin module